MSELLQCGATHISPACVGASEGPTSAQKHGVQHWGHTTCVQVEGVAEWPVEAGPEFVHGGNALLKVGYEMLVTCNPMLMLKLMICKPLQVDTWMRLGGLRQPQTL